MFKISKPGFKSYRQIGIKGGVIRNLVCFIFCSVFFHFKYFTSLCEHKWKCYATFYWESFQHVISIRQTDKASKEAGKKTLKIRKKICRKKIFVFFFLIWVKRFVKFNVQFMQNNRATEMQTHFQFKNLNSISNIS